MSSSRRVRIGLALVAAAVAASGVTTAVRRAGDEDAGSYSGASTPLAGGLVVAEGSRLVGPVFPTPITEGRVMRTAVLRVDADPVAVFQDYIDQLAAQDLTGDLGGGCLVERRKGEEGTEERLVERVSGPVDGIACSAWTTTRDHGYSIYLRRARGFRKDGGVSGMVVTVVTRPHQSRRSTGRTVFALPTPGPPVDADVAPLPEAGDELRRTSPLGCRRRCASSTARSPLDRSRTMAVPPVASQRCSR